jgi:hypothetical protein
MEITVILSWKVDLYTFRHPAPLQLRATKIIRSHNPLLQLKLLKSIGPYLPASQYPIVRTADVSGLSK